MQNLYFNLPSVNLDALDETLQEMFPGLITGISTTQLNEGTRAALKEVLEPLPTARDGEMIAIVHFVQPPTEQQRQQTRAIIDAHDPSLKSQGQQVEETLRQQRQQNLASPIDPTAFGAANQPIRQLAERVAWLEKEMIRLMGGVA